MRTFLSNVFSLTIGNIFTQLIGFVAGVVMITRLSRAEYGLHSAIVALSAIAMPLAILGMLSIATRDLVRKAGREQRDTYASLLTLQLLFSTLTCGAIVVIVWGLGSFTGEAFGLFILGLFGMVWSYAPIVPTEALLAARGRVRRIALLQGFYALFTTLATVVILSRTDDQGALFRGLGRDYRMVVPTLGGNLGLIFIMLAILSVVSIGLYLIQAGQLLPGGIKFAFRPTEWRAYFGQAVPSGLSSAFQQSCLRLGTSLTYALVSSASASYLGVSIFLLTGIVSVIWVPYSINMLPIMTRLYAHSRAQWQWMAGRSVTLLLVVTLPIAIGGMLLGMDILRALLPTQAIAAPTLQVFIWVLPPHVVATFLYQLFLIRGQLRQFMVLSGVGAAANLGISLTLTRLYGAPGAALAAVISSSLIALMAIWRLRGEVGAGIRLLDGLRLAAALAALVITVQVTVGLSVFIRIGLAALVYGAAVLMLGLFTSQDRKTALILLAMGKAN